MTDPAVVPEPDPTDAELRETYHSVYVNESPGTDYRSIEAAHASGLRAVADAAYQRGRDSRDGIVVPTELIERLTEPTRSAEDIIWRQNAIAELRLLAGHTTDKETNNG